MEDIMTVFCLSLSVCDRLSLSLQLNYERWRALLRFFWVAVVVYSMLVLILVYTFQFPSSPKTWTYYTGMSTHRLEDLGLEKFSVPVLFTRIFIPAAFLLVCILHLHYFHQPFLQLTDLKTVITTHTSPITRLVHAEGSLVDLSFARPPPHSLKEERGWQEDQRREDEKEDEEEEYLCMLSRETPSDQMTDLRSSWRLVVDRLTVLFLHSLRSLQELQRLFWWLMELHIIKFVSAYILWVSVKEVCVFNLVFVVCWVVALPYRPWRPLASSICTVWTCIITVCKMLYQLYAIQPSNYSSNCTMPSNSSQEMASSILYSGPVDPAQWVGLRKTDGKLLDYLRYNLVMLALLAFEVTIYRHQQLYRLRSNIAPPPTRSLFQDITRQVLDDGLLSCCKYFLNYFFHKFGVETCFLLAVNVVGQRMDVFAVGHACGLIAVLSRRSRKRIASIWPKYCYFLSGSLCFQYLLCIGFPPAACTDYPWRSPSSYMDSNVVKWLFLPDHLTPPNPLFLLYDLMLLLGASMQLQVFEEETQLSFQILAGDNSELDGDDAQCTEPIMQLPLNTTPDFIRCRSYLDMLKVIMFSYMFWFVLTIIFITGTTRISIFCMGYLVACFYFLLVGGDLLLKPIKSILVYWDCLIGYNVFVITMKNILSILACGYIKSLVLSHCWLIQLFSLACTIKGYAKPEQSSQQCELPSDEAGIIWDSICFGCLLLQRRVFTSHYYLHVVQELHNTQLLASRGAELFKASTVKAVRARLEVEKNSMDLLKRQMERIKARQQKFRRGKERLLSLTRDSTHTHGQEKGKGQRSRKDWWRPWVDHASMVRSGNYYLFETDSEEEDEEERKEEDLPEKSAFQFVYHAWVTDSKTAMRARSAHRQSLWSKYTVGRKRRREENRGVGTIEADEEAEQEEREVEQEEREAGQEAGPDNMLHHVSNMLKFWWVLLGAVLDSLTSWLNSLCQEHTDISTVLRMERCMLTQQAKQGTVPSREAIHDYYQQQMCRLSRECGMDYSTHKAEGETDYSTHETMGQWSRWEQVAESEMEGRDRVVTEGGASEIERRLPETGREPLETGKGPLETGKGLIETGRGPIETEEGLLETERGPLETERGLEEIGSGLVETGREPLETGVGLLETGKGLLETGRGSIETGRGPLEEERGLEETGSGLVQTGRGPVETEKGLVATRRGGSSGPAAVVQEAETLSAGSVISHHLQTETPSLGDGTQQTASADFKTETVSVDLEAETADSKPETVLGEDIPAHSKTIFPQQTSAEDSTSETETSSTALAVQPQMHRAADFQTDFPECSVAKTSQRPHPRLCRMERIDLSSSFSSSSSVEGGMIATSSQCTAPCSCQETLDSTEDSNCQPPSDSYSQHTHSDAHTLQTQHTHTQNFPPSPPLSSPVLPPSYSLALGLDFREGRKEKRRKQRGWGKGVSLGSFRKRLFRREPEKKKDFLSGPTSTSCLTPSCTQELTASELLKKKMFYDEDLEASDCFYGNQPQLLQLCYALYNILVARSETVCYLVIVLNHMVSGNCLTLLLPICIFLWAMLSVPRPSKTFWMTAIIYTEVTIVIKYFFQFSFFPFNQKVELERSKPFHPPNILGVEKKEGYVIYDLIQLLALFFHRAILKCHGLWDQSVAVETSCHDNDQKDTTPCPAQAWHPDSVTQNALRQRSGRQSRTYSCSTHPHSSGGSVCSSAQQPTRSDLFLEKLREILIRAKKLTVSKCVCVCGPVLDFFRALVQPEYSAVTDVYVLMFLADTVDFIIIVFGFWAFGKHTAAADITSSLSEDQVPEAFLVMVLIQFGTMVIDRALYLRKTVLGKLVFQVILVFGIHFWLFFILPTVTERRFNQNSVAQLWYFVKCVYFGLSAYQIRSGYPTRVLGNFLTKSHNYLNLFLFQGFRLVPFLTELRAVMDWVWTDTTLSLSSWICVEDVYAHTFVLKCWRESERRYPQPRGQRKKRVVKYGMGGLIVVLLICIVWFPLLFMSLVKSVAGVINKPLDVSLTITLGGFQPIFTMSAQQNQLYDLTEEDFKTIISSYSYTPSALQFLEAYTKEDVTVAELQGSSNSLWTISPPSRQYLMQLLSLDQHFPLTMSWTIQRNLSLGAKAELASGKHVTYLDDQTRLNLIELLNGTRDSPVVIENVFPCFLRAPSDSNAKPIEQLYTGEVYKSILLALERATSQSRDIQEWWIVDQSADILVPVSGSESVIDRRGAGLQLFVFSDKVSPPSLGFLAGYGIMGLYASVVLVIGKFVREFFSGISHSIMFEELPCVDRILKLCTDIFLVRETGELELEEELYAKLIFLYRSPETLIKWTRR
ncbi:piezo-type mechanosensitive ion channel component 2-like isoform X2 [Lampris incognitus]|uniref:piezo-type mechanosensitive ion channel component 2-like isoform X2 n=1 Tax=Lampris incognitus TaxID=2546036 RepID=UPI0024B4D51B|nr:piezo-type mechanosensitive ion channel component 2-like isoform X2 [Lampris incognitus]